MVVGAPPLLGEGAEPDILGGLAVPARRCRSDRVPWWCRAMWLSGAERMSPTILSRLDDCLRAGPSRRPQS